MDVKDYLWYPYLRYQAECREKGKEDSIQEWLELTGKVDKPQPAVKKVTTPQRARNKKGHYVSDDPSTPDKNEAWIGGKAPKIISAIKPKRARRKKS